MKNHFFKALMVTLIAASGMTQAADNKVFTQDYDMRELANGLKVIVVKTDYPGVVSLQMPIQTGSRNEVEPGKSGFAHFFEHMMFRGTENYTQEEYGALLKEMGADQNAYTTDDYTNYHVTFVSEDLEKNVGIGSRSFQKPEVLRSPVSHRSLGR